MSFHISNRGKQDSQFYNALKHPVMIPPGGSVTVPADMMTLGVLRIFDKDQSHFITTLSEEAANKLAESRAPVKRNSGGIYGKGMQSFEEVFERERGQLLRVTDNFTPVFRKAHPEGHNASGHIVVQGEQQKANLDEAPPLPESSTDPANEAAKRVFIREEQTPQTPPQPPQPGEPAPPPADASVAQKFIESINTLIAQADGPDSKLETKDVRRRAKEILGEDYPSGNVSREDMIAALRRSINKGG